METLSTVTACQIEKSKNFVCSSIDEQQHEQVKIVWMIWIIDCQFGNANRKLWIRHFKIIIDKISLFETKSEIAFICRKERNRKKVNDNISNKTKNQNSKFDAKVKYENETISDHNNLKLNIFFLKITGNHWYEMCFAYFESQ